MPSPRELKARQAKKKFERARSSHQALLQTLEKSVMQRAQVSQSCVVAAAQDSKENEIERLNLEQEEKLEDVLLSAPLSTISIRALNKKESALYNKLLIKIKILENEYIDDAMHYFKSVESNKDKIEKVRQAVEDDAKRFSETLSRLAKEYVIEPCPEKKKELKAQMDIEVCIAGIKIYSENYLVHKLRTEEKNPAIYEALKLKEEALQHLQIALSDLGNSQESGRYIPDKNKQAQIRLEKFDRCLQENAAVLSNHRDTGPFGIFLLFKWLARKFFGGRFGVSHGNSCVEFFKLRHNVFKKEEKPILAKQLCPRRCY